MRSVVRPLPQAESGRQVANRRLPLGFNQAVPMRRQRAVNRREQVDRAAKKEMVTELNGVFKASSVVVVAHYAGLTVAECSFCAGR